MISALGNEIVILRIALIITPQTLLHTARLALTQPPLRNPLPHKIRAHVDEPLLVDEVFDLPPGLAVGEHVDSLEDDHLAVGVHAFRVGNGLEFAVFVNARARDRAAGPQFAKFLEEVYDGFPVEGVDGAFALLLLFCQDVGGFDEAFDRDVLAFEALLVDLVGDGAGDEAFTASWTACQGDESAVFGLLAGMVRVDAISQKGGEVFGFHDG